MEMWSRERNYGLGSNLGGGKCGPRREIMVLGQALVAGSVVQGEKLRPRVKPVSPGQARPRPSVVRGSKTVAPGQARVPRSPPAPPEHGPRT